ncbi:MAG: hypothetical protein II757_03060 [Bacteroidales bacterium]|nr:hypothetical protein [Bacteroidales bacterium]
MAATLNIRDYFGSTFDYFLFGLRSNGTLLDIMNAVSDRVSCVFTLLPYLQLMHDQLTAKFPLAFTQFEMRGPTIGSSIDYTERLNIVLFQNFTEDFEVLSETTAPTLFDGNLSFENDDEVASSYCYALNKVGRRLCSWGLRDMPYLLYIFSKKDKDAADFREFVSTLDMEKYDLTDLIREEHLQYTDKQRQTKKLPEHINLIRAIVSQAERKIRALENPAV